MYVFSYFPFGFEGGIWDLIVSVPDHCLSFSLGGLPRDRVVRVTDRVRNDIKCVERP